MCFSLVNFLSAVVSSSFCEFIVPRRFCLLVDVFADCVSTYVCKENGCELRIAHRVWGCIIVGLADRVALRLEFNFR